ncbi:MAG: HD-GYP domain-containing protein [Actinomycetota bacterium]
MGGLPRRARLMVVGVVAAAIFALPFAVAGVSRWTTVLALAAMFFVSDSLKATRVPVSLGLGYVVALAALPLVGGRGAMVIAAFGLFTRIARLVWYKNAFNGAQMALAAGSAGLVYSLLGGPTNGLTSSDFPAVFLPMAAAGLVFGMVNGALVATVVAMAEGGRVREIWYSGMSRTAIPYLGYGLFGLLLAVLWSDLGWVAAPLLFLPLLLARWAYAQYVEEQLAYDRTIRSLVQAVETKDWYTRGHSERVSKASVLIARGIGMRENRVASLRYAGILHDVGKLGVPTKVLQKSGPLTPDEFAAIKLHPVRGIEVLRGIEFLGETVAGILHHHERIDGTGYPMGLKGDQIPEFARVIAVADAFDSMTSTRSYRQARTVEDAVGELQRCAGTQFDPLMVAALVGGVATQGWEPQAPPEAPEEVLVASAACYDHDDPTAPPPVLDRDLDRDRDRDRGLDPSREQPER